MDKRTVKASKKYEWNIGLCKDGNMPSRPNDYQFYLSGGCVFADFKVVKEDGNEILQLIRISFDGHGCADREELNLKMNAYDSKLLKQIIDRDDSAAHEDDMREIMATFIEQIRSYLWEDALRDNLDM